MTQNEVYDGPGGDVTFYKAGTRKRKDGSEFEAGDSWCIHYHGRKEYIQPDSLKFFLKMYEENEKFRERVDRA